MSCDEYVHGIEAAEVFERLDPRLNRFCGSSVPLESIKPFIRRGKYGLDGLCDLLSELVRREFFKEDMLEGKLLQLDRAMREL